MSVVARAHATISDSSAAAAGAPAAILAHWPLILCALACLILTGAIAYALYRCLSQTRIRSVEGGVYTLLPDVRTNIEHLKSWVSQKLPPEDYRMLASMWLLAMLQVVDVGSDLLALAAMARNLHGQGYFLTNLMAILVVNPLVACAGMAGEQQRHPALPSTLVMALTHFLQIPGVVLAGLATRLVFWSPLRGKTTWENWDVEASEAEYSALKAVSRQLEAVGLGEATIEAATGLLVQGLYLLQEEVEDTTPLYRSLLISMVSLANAYATLDKDGQVLKSIRNPERQSQEIAVVVGCVPAASAKYVLLLLFRLADSIAFIGACLFMHTAARQSWWHGKPCPMLLCVMLSAFLARAGLFASNTCSFAALRTASTSMVGFAGPVMLRLSFPFMGLSAMTFYSLRAVETLGSVALVVWLDPVVRAQRWPLALTWLCASFSMWPLLAVLSACKPAAPEPEAATALVSNYLQAVLPEDRDKTPITPCSEWLAPERAAIQAQLAPPPAQRQLHDGGPASSITATRGGAAEPIEFRDLPALMSAMQADSTVPSIKLIFNNIGPAGAKSIAEQLHRCPQLKSLDLHYNDIGPEGAKAIAVQLHHCPQLQRLKLDGNKIKDAGTKILAEQLHRCPQLQHFDLIHNGITSEGAKFVADQLHGCPQLQRLSLSENEIGDLGTKILLEQLHHCAQLQSLGLCANGITSECAKFIAGQLHQFPQLQEIDLSANFRIDDEGAKAIAQQLLQHRTAIRSVNLGRTDVLCSDVTFWIYFLFSTQVTSILLGSKAFSLFPLSSHRCCQSQVQQMQELEPTSFDTPLSPVCQSFILFQLQEVSAIRKLRLEYVGAEMITKLFKAVDKASSGRLNLQRLEELVLGCNDLGLEEARVIAESVLPNCPQLQRLDLSYNELDSEGAKILVEQLRRCPRLQSLDLGSNNIGDEGEEAVRAAVRAHCPAMRDLRL